MKLIVIRINLTIPIYTANYFVIIVFSITISHFLKHCLSCNSYWWIYFICSKTGAPVSKPPILVVSYNSSLSAGVNSMSIKYCITKNPCFFTTWIFPFIYLQLVSKQCLSLSILLNHLYSAILKSSRLS